MRPPVRKGELLSSWINRLAFANGVSPDYMCGFIRHECGQRMRDARAFGSQGPFRKESAAIDLRCELGTVEYLSARTGVDPKLIRAAAVLAPKFTDNREAPPSGFLHWRLCGVDAARVLPWDEERPGEHSEGRLKFCPLCLSEDETPWFRKVWRTRYAEVCPRHGTLLLGMCSSCGVGVRPHGLKRGEHQAVCHGCGDDLRRQSALRMGDAVVMRQMQVYDILRRAQKEMASNPSGDWDIAADASARALELVAPQDGEAGLGELPLSMVLCSFEHADARPAEPGSVSSFVGQPLMVDESHFDLLS